MDKTKEEISTFICEVIRDHFSDPNETRPFYWLNYSSESIEMRFSIEETSQRILYYEDGKITKIIHLDHDYINNTPWILIDEIHSDKQ